MRINRPTIIWAIGGAAVVLILGYLLIGPVEEVQVAVTVPELSAEAEIGSELFAAHCASCHGANAAGSSNGPPLVHAIYEPSHHSDVAFVLAASQGVRAHHWRFGNMPPVEGVREDEVAKIIAYVRELQVANGID